MITQSDLDKVYSVFDGIVYTPKMTEEIKLKIQLADLIINNSDVFSGHTGIIRDIEIHPAKLQEIGELLIKLMESSREPQH